MFSRPTEAAWAKAVAVGSMALAAARCLSITPAQADGGGWATDPPDVPVSQGEGIWSTPEKVAEFLADCG